jgi:hypothetical protein
MHSPQVSEVRSVSHTSLASQPLPQATSHSQEPSTQISVAGQKPVGWVALHNGSQDPPEQTSSVGQAPYGSVELQDGTEHTPLSQVAPPSHRPVGLSAVHSLVESIGMQVPASQVWSSGQSPVGWDGVHSLLASIGTQVPATQTLPVAQVPLGSSAEQAPLAPAVQTPSTQVSSAAHASASFSAVHSSGGS